MTPTSVLKLVKTTSFEHSYRKSVPFFYISEGERISYEIITFYERYHWLKTNFYSSREHRELYSSSNKYCEQSLKALLYLYLLIHFGMLGDFCVLTCLFLLFFICFLFVKKAEDEVMLSLNCKWIPQSGFFYRFSTDQFLFVHSVVISYCLKTDHATNFMQCMSSNLSIVLIIILIIIGSPPE